MTKKLLAAIKRDENDSEDCLVSNISELKIREYFVNTFTRKFIVIIYEYQEAQSEYSKVASESCDVLILKASVAELHGMFLDFALLIGEQGDPLDNIEYNAKDESRCIDIGCYNNFSQALELRRKIRRKQFFIATTCLLIITVIIIIVVITQLLQGR